MVCEKSKNLNLHCSSRFLPATQAKANATANATNLQPAFSAGATDSQKEEDCCIVLGLLGRMRPSSESQACDVLRILSTYVDITLDAV